MNEPLTYPGLDATPEDERVKLAEARTRRAAAAMPAVSVGSRLESDPTKSSYAGYLFGSSGTADRPAWSDSAGGRAAIRLISRGIAGSTFFVLGGHIADKQMKGYESFKTFADLKAEGKLRPLHYVARGWDMTAGKLIEGISYAVTVGDKHAKAHAAWESTCFRTKLYQYPLDKPNKTHPDAKSGIEFPLNGRGLGEEIVRITFDFFCASIGDAMTRNIIQAFDPNIKQPWLLDKDGKATTRDKGKFDGGRWLQSVGRASWRIFSKNAMEDWAAALPYVYQMKWQRQVIAKWWDGAKLFLDNSTNGAGAKVDDHGHIRGGYQAAGAIDLHCRFVGYNWYTLMYREMYDALGRGFTKWQQNGFKVEMPQIGNPVTGAINSVGFFSRYMVKSFLKANLYMQPAVIPFWLMRTPQSKWRGYFGHEATLMADDKSKAATSNALLQFKPLENVDPKFTEGSPHFLVNTTENALPRFKLKHDPRTYDIAYWGNGAANFTVRDSNPNHVLNAMNNPYSFNIKRKPYEAVLNAFGAVSFHSGSKLVDVVDWISGNKANGPIERSLFLSQKEKKLWNDKTVPQADKMAMLASKNLPMEREKLVRKYTDAAFAYTPYMWAKAETALHVDDRRNIDELGHMDKALYKFIDGLVTFDFKTAGSALKDVKTLAFNIEKEVKSREGGTITGDGTIIPRAIDREPPPNSKIDVKTVHRVPAGKEALVPQLSAANDPELPPHAANDDPRSQRQWAEAVAGRKLEAEYQPSRAVH